MKIEVKLMCLWGLRLARTVSTQNACVTEPRLAVLQMGGGAYTMLDAALKGLGRASASL